MIFDTLLARYWEKSGTKHTIAPRRRWRGTFVRKGLTFVERTIKQGNIETRYTFTKITPSKQSKGIVFLLNVYSNPKHIHQKFRSHFYQASTRSKGSPLMISGDDNSSQTSWGYKGDTIKRRDQLQSGLNNRYIHTMDPARIGNSVGRETTPDLTFFKNDRTVKMAWANIKVDPRDPDTRPAREETLTRSYR
ncbi:hypothetical protein HPB48_015879 [Haemaphysalis longicornis]|uniref:Endonuclease/exonuclease/phosphatase domain-containing protein n=1 Tax=Haemaphysalis longicornis TaxID=44386 RepID=A0A9J6GEQ8_HAELO|nr:hypothetical protein HPB48_015879 [Haemaphysalis longicornis]